MSGTGKRAVWVAIPLMAAITVSACSSSSSTSTSSGSGSGLKGKPVVLGLIGEENTAGLSFPDAQKAAKIAASAVNAAGGIKGRPVQIDFCNTQNSPQQSSVCAERVLGQDKAVMIAGGSTVTQTAPLYQSAKLHNTFVLGELPYTNQDLTSSLSYPILPGAFGNLAVSSVLPKGTTTLAIPNYPTPASSQNIKRILAKLPSGIKTTQISVSLTASSFQSYCLKAKQAGAQVVLPLLASGALTTMASTCQQIGYSPTWLLSTGSIDSATVKTFSAKKLENRVIVDYSASVLSQFQADTAKYGSSVGGLTDTYGDVTLTAWLAVKAAAKVLNASKDVTGSSAMAYLKGLSGGLDIGLSSPLNWNSAGPVSGAPRMVLRQVTSGTISGGKLSVGSSALPIAG